MAKPAHHRTLKTLSLALATTATLALVPASAAIAAPLQPIDLASQHANDDLRRRQCRRRRAPRRRCRTARQCLPLSQHHRGAPGWCRGARRSRRRAARIWLAFAGPVPPGIAGDRAARSRPVPRSASSPPAPPRLWLAAGSGHVLVLHRHDADAGFLGLLPAVKRQQACERSERKASAFRFFVSCYFFHARALRWIRAAHGE